MEKATFASANSAVLTKLFEIANYLNSNLEVHAILTEVIRGAEELVAADAASLLLVDENTQELVFHVALGEKGDQLEERRLPPGQGIAGWVAEHGEPLNIDDVNADERFAVAFDKQSGYHTRNLLAVPVERRDRIVGVLEALNKEGGPFTEEDRYLLELLADQAAIALDNARLLAEVRAMNAELETRVAQRTHELAVANARLNAVLDSVNEGMATLSGDLEIEWMNEVLENWFCPLPEAQGRPYAEVFTHAGEVEGVCPGRDALNTGRVERVEELALQCRQGERLCEVTAVPMHDEETGEARVLLTFHDITARKQLEAAEVNSARLQMMNEVVASVNHEINNPLMTVLANAEMLEQSLGPVHAKLQRKVSAIAQGARRVAAVTEKLASLSDPVSRTYTQHARMLDLRVSEQDSAPGRKKQV